MRFPRQTKVFKGQLDAAPFAGVFFCLLLLLLLHGSLVFRPGVPIDLPVADLPGVDQPTAVVAVDAAGRLYYENQLVSEQALEERLRSRVRQTQEAMTLVIEADRAVVYERLIQLGLMARNAGFRTALLATRPVLPPTATP